MRIKKPLSLVLCLVLVAMLFPWGTVFARAEGEQSFVLDGWKDQAGNADAVQGISINGASFAQSGAAIAVEPGATLSVTIALAEGYTLTSLPDGNMLRLESGSGAALATSASESSIVAPGEDWFTEHPDEQTMFLCFLTQKSAEDPDDTETVENMTIKITAPECGNAVEYDAETAEYTFVPEVKLSPEQLQPAAQLFWLAEDAEGFLGTKTVTETFTVKGGESYYLGVQIILSPDSATEESLAGRTFVPKTQKDPVQLDSIGFVKEKLNISVDGGTLVRFDVFGEGSNAIFCCVLELKAEHIPGEPKNENVVPALCTVDGSHDEVVYCTACQEELSRETVTDPMIGHDWNEWVVSKEPTIDEPGERARVCKHNPKHKETEEIPMLESCTVSFETNGGSEVPAVRVEKGKHIEEPEEPTKDKATFDCWCSDPELNIVYDFSTPVNEDITLYAKWNETGKVKYTVISGGGSIWGKGGVREIEIVVKRSVDDKSCFSHFTGVQIDGQDLTIDTDYTAKAGSTVITLKPVAMNRFNTGNHTVTILFDDGKAVAGLIIKAGTGGGGGGRGGNANTGDSDPAIWIGAIALSALCISGITIVLVNKGKKK